MDITTETNVYGDKRYVIAGKEKTIVVYPSPVRGLWCVGSWTVGGLGDVITEDLKLIPAICLGLHMSMHGFTSHQQMNRMITQAHKA